MAILLKCTSFVGVQLSLIPLLYGLLYQIFLSIFQFDREDIIDNNMTETT
jgi:hypothetical protein